MKVHNYGNDYVQAVAFKKQNETAHADNENERQEQETADGGEASKETVQETKKEKAKQGKKKSAAKNDVQEHAAGELSAEKLSD